MTGLPRVTEEFVVLDSLPNESLLVIDSSDPCYGDIIIYLQTQHFRPDISKDDSQWICHQAQHYLIVGDAIYHRGREIVLC